MTLMVTRSTEHQEKAGRWLGEILRLMQEQNGATYGCSDTDAGERMDAFETWWRSRFPDEAQKWDDPLYAGTEWRENNLRFLRDVRREAWEAGIDWERKRRALCLASAPNLERLREMEGLIDGATHNVSDVSGEWGESA